MSNKLISLEINLKNDPAQIRSGDPVRGTLTVLSHTEVGLNHFGYRVVMRIRGKLSPDERVIHEEMFVHQTHWFAGEEETFPIAFEAPATPSYKGINVNFDWQIESVIDYDAGTDARIRGQAIRRLNLLKVINPERGSGEVLPFTITPANHHYTVEDAPADPVFLFSGIKGLLGSLSIALVLFMIGVIVFNAIMDSGWVGWGIGLGALALVAGAVGGYYYLATSTLGKVEMHVQQKTQDAFELHVSIGKDTRSIRAAEAWYEIREKVTDDRGTSTTTYNKCLFSSEKVPMNPMPGDMEATLALPDLYYPHTTSRMNVRLYWVVKVRLNIGLPYTYEKEIWVSQDGRDLMAEL